MTTAAKARAILGRVLRRATAEPSESGFEIETRAATSHIAIQEKQDGSPVTWLDQVTDAQYGTR